MSNILLYLSSGWNFEGIPSYSILNQSEAKILLLIFRRMMSDNDSDILWVILKEFAFLKTARSNSNFELNTILISLYNF